ALAAAELMSGSAIDQRRMPDGKQWTTANLDVFIRPSYCYDDSDAQCRRYGRLYTWQAAQDGCRTLGDGWRLPTEEDWRRLAKFYGGISDDSTDGGTAAYAALVSGGISAFDAVLGDNRTNDGRYERLEAHGFYWTASESEPGSAW